MPFIKKRSNLFASHGLRLRLNHYGALTQLSYLAITKIPLSISTFLLFSLRTNVSQRPISINRFKFYLLLIMESKLCHIRVRRRNLS